MGLLFGEGAVGSVSPLPDGERVGVAGQDGPFSPDLRALVEDPQLRSSYPRRRVPPPTRYQFEKTDSAPGPAERLRGFDGLPWGAARALSSDLTVR
jgi:hypothetical protein